MFKNLRVLTEASTQRKNGGSTGFSEHIPHKLFLKGSTGFTSAITKHSERNVDAANAFQMINK